MMNTENFEWMFNSTTMLLMMLYHIAIAAGIIFFVIYIIKSFSRNNTKKIGSTNGMEILEERFAKGEINEEEYKRMKTVILDGKI